MRPSALSTTASDRAADRRLLQGGQEYFPALIEALDGARRCIQLETYIFDVHGAGALVAHALMRAAERGVRVQVLVDGLGTPDLPPAWLTQMHSAGVQWRVFAPLGRSWTYARLLLAPSYWRRLHRKLCVVDEQLLFCGGINVLDDLYDPNHGELQAPRFDFAVRLEGPVAQQAAQAMALLWEGETARPSARPAKRF